MKITPTRNFNDFAVGKRRLEMINVLNVDGTLNEEGGRSQGSVDGRTDALKEKPGLGDRGSKEHVMALPRSQRSGVPVEPMLSTQWFVRMEDLAAPAIEAIETGRTKFVPKTWENTYYAWMRNIQDWCISRQLWWGHRIPAWYDAQGNVYVGRDEAEVRARHQLAEDVVLAQDEDVLDTWFSSRCGPFQRWLVGRYRVFEEVLSNVRIDHRL